MILQLMVAAPCRIYTIAIILQLCILLIEVTLLYMGGSLSKVMSSFEQSLDIELDADGWLAPLSKCLGWLHVGKVPLLILFIVFLTFFGISGIILQTMSYQYLGYFLNNLIIGPMACWLALLNVRMVGKFAQTFFPTDETSAVDIKNFIGKLGVVCQGQATCFLAAEAKVVDRYGQNHYVFVKPYVTTDIFKQDDKVILIKYVNGIFYVNLAPSQLVH